MSLSTSDKTEKNNSLNIPEILAAFFLKKIDMPSYSDDSDNKHKSKRKKSKHKKRKHKKSKHRHGNKSSDSSSESPKTNSKVLVDDVSKYEELDIQRLKKIKNVKLQSVNKTVLQTASLPDDQETTNKSDMSNCSTSKNLEFYGPSVLLPSNTEPNDSSTSNIVENVVSGISKDNGDDNLNETKNSSQSNCNPSKQEDSVVSSDLLSTESLKKDINSITVSGETNAGKDTKNVDNSSDSVLEKSSEIQKISVSEKTNPKENCKSNEKLESDVEQTSYQPVVKLKNVDKKKKQPRSHSRSKSRSRHRSPKSKHKRRSSRSSSRDSYRKRKKLSRSHSREKKKHSRSRSREKKKRSRSHSREKRKRSRSHSREKKKCSRSQSREKNKRSRSHSREKKNRSRSREKKRSRSHSREKKKRSRSHSREKKKRSRSHSREKKKRSRSQSQERLKSRDHKNRPRSRSRSGSRHKKTRKRSRSRSRSPYERRDRRRSRSRSRSGRKHRNSSNSRKRHRSYSRGRGSSVSKSRRRSRSRRRSASVTRSRSKSKTKRSSRSKEKSRSRSLSREKKKSSSTKIDQAKILETARKNVLKMMKNGTLPEGLPVENLKKEQLITIQSGGKSVQELTDFCQRLSQKENEPDDNEDKEDKADENTGFIHHPFKMKEPGMIKLNIKNAVQLPIKTHAQKVAETARLSSQFPVSSGNKHKQKELEWIPVVPASTTKSETIPAKTVVTTVPANTSNADSNNKTVKALPETPVVSVASPPVSSIPMPVSYPSPSPEVTVVEMPALPPPPLPPPPLPPILKSSMLLPTVYPMPVQPAMPSYVMPNQEMTTSTYTPYTPTPTISLPPTPPTTTVFKPPKKLDIPAIVAKRFQALTKLQQDPSDPEALRTMQNAQESIQEWVESQQVPGLFTGSTDAKMLTAAELCGPKFHKIRKDIFTHAPPVTGGKGMSLLKKMGWNPGEGLGKNKEGSLEPLMLDIKTDKKGLVSEGENSKKGTNSFIKELQGKHPVSALMELCSKRRWKPPLYTCVMDQGPAHRKQFVFKVEVNGVEYQPVNPCTNKKIAKADSAVLCLQSLNILSKAV